MKIKHLDASDTGGRKTSRVKYAVIAGAVLFAILIAAVFGIEYVGNQAAGQDRVSFSPRGLFSYRDDNSSFFLNGQEVISFDGAASNGKSTPDRTKYIVLQEDKKLLLYGENDTDGKVISDNSSGLGSVLNAGCFYTIGEKEHLYYYDFSTGESTDVGYEGMSPNYSSGGKTVVAINDKGEMLSFSTESKTTTSLCNAGTDASICCIADDGSNVLWSTKSGNTYSVYMMKNGAPERIGKLTNSEKYSGCYGFFFNNGKSFLVYSSNSAQMILSKNGEIIEFTLPGVKTYDPLLNSNGMYIDSDDDNIDVFYVAVAKNKDSSVGQIYRMTSSGELILEADDVNLNISYYIRSGYLYYTNKDNDLMQKKLGEETADLITTEVTNIFVSSDDKYIYLVKLGGLYYWDTTDKSYNLTIITSSLTSEYKFYLTDIDETVFYISDMQDIEDSYRTKGTAYRFTVGDTPEKISDDIMEVLTIDTRYPNAITPVFMKYISNEKYDYVVEYGTVVDGSYERLITNINH